MMTLLVLSGLVFERLLVIPGAHNYVFFTHSGSRYALEEPVPWFKQEMEDRGYWDEDNPLEPLMRLSQATRDGLMAIDQDSEDEDEDDDDDDDEEDDEEEEEEEVVVPAEESEEEPEEEEEEDEEPPPQPTARARRGSVRRITYGA